MGFQVPSFQMALKRQVEIEFHGTVPTLGYLTVSAGPITYKFRIINVKLYFDQEADNLLEYRLYTSPGRLEPTGYWPADFNLFGAESPTAGFFGRSIVKELNTGIEVGEVNQCIKFAAHNLNTYACFASASVTLQEI